MKVVNFRNDFRGLDVFVVESNNEQEIMDHFTFLYPTMTPCVMKYLNTKNTFEVTIMEKEEIDLVD